jgi:hypothetical protein
VQVQTVLADPQTAPLLDLLKRERAGPGGAEERARYFEDARGVMPDENIYRIDWVRVHRQWARRAAANIRAGRTQRPR